MTARSRMRAPRPLLAALGACLVILGGLVACSGSSSSTSVPVTGVTLNLSTLSLTVGDSPVSLVASVSPSNATNTAVIWSSSNAAVAAVSDAGLVTAVAAGTASIAVETKDGAMTATCSVTVVAAAVAVTSISLDKSTLNLVAGAAAAQLVVTLTPSSATNKSVTWLSSDNHVATVSPSGEVTPLAAGSATITVKTSDGTKAATCAVKVTAAPIAVTGVTLDKSELDMTLNSVAPALVATVAPANATDRAISWSSDNAVVATVDAGGVVTAKAAGTATVSVTTHDGSLTASCFVNVTQPSNAVTGVTLDLTRLELVVGALAEKVTATVVPANADNLAVTWASSNAQVATVDSTGVITAVGSGTANVTATTTEGGYVATCSVAVHSDAVTSLVATASLTGQLALAWTDPVDLNATGIQVTIQSTEGSASRSVQIGKKQTAFSGLTIDSSYTFALRVLGASGTSSDEVTATGTPVKVVKLLHSGYAETVNWGNNGQTFYLTDSNGSTSTTETYDCIIGTSVEISDPIHFPAFPMNYRWVLLPGLADSTDPTLVSLKNVAYNKATQVWEETQRYLHVNKAKAEAGTDAIVDSGQYYNWTIGGLHDNSTNNYNAFADLIDVSDAAFNADATFRMIAGTVAGSVSLVWYADSATPRRLLPDYFHVQVRDSSFPIPGDYGTGDYATRSSWVLEDVSTQTP